MVSHSNDKQLTASLWSLERNGDFSTAGAVAVALFITERARVDGLPLDALSIATAKGTQVRGLNGKAVQTILKRYSTSSWMIVEGGRTSRGSLQRAKQYTNWLNESYREPWFNLDQIQRYWVDRAKRFERADTSADADTIPEQAAAPLSFQVLSDERIGLDSSPDLPSSVSDEEFLFVVARALQDYRSAIAGSNEHVDLDRALSLIYGLCSAGHERLLLTQFDFGFSIVQLEHLIAEYDRRNEALPTLDTGPLGALKGVLAGLKLIESRLPRWQEFLQGATRNDRSTIVSSEEAASFIAESESVAVTVERNPSLFESRISSAIRKLGNSFDLAIRRSRIFARGLALSICNLARIIAQRAYIELADMADAATRGLGHRVGLTIRVSILVAITTEAASLVGLIPQEWAWLRSAISAFSTHVRL